MGHKDSVCHGYKLGMSCRILGKGLSLKYEDFGLESG
jgi:hypothetical protein